MGAARRHPAGAGPGGPGGERQRQQVRPHGSGKRRLLQYLPSDPEDRVLRDVHSRGPGRGDHRRPADDPEGREGEEGRVTGGADHALRQGGLYNRTGGPLHHRASGVPFDGARTGCHGDSSGNRTGEGPAAAHGIPHRHPARRADHGRRAFPRRAREIRKSAGRNLWDPAFFRCRDKILLAMQDAAASCPSRSVGWSRGPQPLESLTPHRRVSIRPQRCHAGPTRPSPGW